MLDVNTSYLNYCPMSMSISMNKLPALLSQVANENSTNTIPFIVSRSCVLHLQGTARGSTFSDGTLFENERFQVKPEQIRFDVIV